MNRKEDQNKKLYVEDDGPIYYPIPVQTEPWDGWDTIILIVILVGIVAMSCGVPILIFF